MPFVRGRGGEYRVSYDPKLSSVFFNPRAMHTEGTDPFERWMDVVGIPGRSEMSVMLDLGKLQEVPPQAQLLLERVETVPAVQLEIDPAPDRIAWATGLNLRSDLKVQHLSCSVDASGLASFSFQVAVEGEWVDCGPVRKGEACSPLAGGTGTVPISWEELDRIWQDHR